MPAPGLLVKFSSRGIGLKHFQRICLRSFLSDAYKCESEWRARLNSPVCLKLQNENLYGELIKKFNNESRVNAIDVDMFSTMITKEANLKELEDITHRFRRSPSTVHALPCTGHSVIRTFLEFNKTDTLMRLLDDRLNYGLFLDYYLSNLLMDTFLKQENYRDAVKVAIQLMLQEEFDHQITCPLALYSCYAYLKNPQPEPWEPQPKPKEEEPAEEVKVRVDYLREPYFDDHFDLTDPEHLIGKTLVGFGKHLARQKAEPLAHSSVLLGWILFEKYDKALECLNTICNSSAKPAVFRECLDLCQKKVTESSKQPDGFMDKWSSLTSQLEKGNLIADGSAMEVLKRRITDAVAAQETKDIQVQAELYKRWEKLREDEIEKEIQALDRQRRLAILEAKKKELAEKEERLNFFDNLDDWELKYEEKELERQAQAKELESRSKKISAKMQRQAEEDAYFPPEITSRRSGTE
nr:EOG090X05Q1 [Macrothrix elegans]